MSAPAVTVLLAVFNGGPLLRLSIDSVLAQTFADFELLVIDDGSTDATPAILRGYNDARLRVVVNERNLGLTRSLNRGLAEARGALIARQDADDLSDSGRLAQQVAFLRENPEVRLLGSSAWRIDSAGRVTGANDLPCTHDAIRWASVLDNPFLHTSVMFHRETALAEFGGYDERFAICQDYDLWNRIAARHRVANLPARLVRMREHATSMTASEPGATTAESRRILDENRASVFPGRAFTEEERRLLGLFRLRFSARELPALRRLLAQLLEEFLAMHPEARASADFRATLCRQALRLAHKFLATDRRAAAREAARAFPLSPGEWMRQAATSLRVLLP